MDNKLISWISEASDAREVENEHKTVTRLGFLLAPLSCCGDGSGLVLWALTGRTKTEEKARSLSRGALPEWEAFMEEFLIKGQNEILRADRGKACCREHNLTRLTECVWRLDFFSAPNVLFEGCLCVCITWEDAPTFPKAVEMQLKASPKNAI